MASNPSMEPEDPDVNIRLDSEPDSSLTIADPVRPDAFIINIGVNFDIIVAPNFNNSETITKCINSLTSYFEIDKWQINEPILIKDLFILLDKVQGVQTVQNVEIINLTGASLGYSEFAYDVSGAEIDNVIYPSIDPMVFELKYPNQDIKGRVVPL